MKKVLIFLILALVLSLTSFAYDDSKNQKNNDSIIKVIEKNQQIIRSAYSELLEDVGELMHQLVSGNISLKEKKELKIIFDAKIKLLKSLLNQIDSVNKIVTNSSFNEKETPVKCASCNGKGCKACGNDGYGYSPDLNPVKCGNCSGNGSVAGLTCPGCNGIGYANSFPDPPSK